MEFGFPYPVRVLSQTAALMGMRGEPFTNIDGEPFGKPQLNGFWRIEMEVYAKTRMAAMALSAFITAMQQGGTTAIVPICTMGRPTDDTGREIAGIHPGPDYPTDHTGFEAQDYPGVTLETAAFHRDSYIDIAKPALTTIWPGHYVSIKDRLYQVIMASAVNDDDERMRLTVRPPIRGNHDPGDVVVINQLRVRCMLHDAQQVGFAPGNARTTSLTFIEAF